MSQIDDTQPLAAIDLGSNSFHMIVGRMQNGQLQIIDRLREPVRLAEGLTEDHGLEDAVAQRALACLERFGERVRALPSGNVRAVGTNTLRKAQSAGNFRRLARSALGHEIEVISGIEEARLVHAGVVHSLSDPDERRLVVDIGGGSTELIVGEGLQALQLESLYMGCVSFSQRFFENGSITKEAMKDAILAARLEMEGVQRSFRRAGWTRAIGSSGTIRAIQKAVLEAGWSDNGITSDALKQLRVNLVDAGHADNISFESINADRKPVLAGGVAVLSAVFEALKIDRMVHSSGALREGLLYDLVGRLQHQDVRAATIASFAERYHVDLKQAKRVEATAQRLAAELASAWRLPKLETQRWLNWAASVHEIGLVIAHSAHQKHAAYLLEYSDMPGFSQHDQQFLSTLVRFHRRKLREDAFQDLIEDERGYATRLCAILRLAVLLHRNRSSKALPDIRVAAEGDMVKLLFPEDWLEAQPLTLADLKSEKKQLAVLGIRLSYL